MARILKGSHSFICTPRIHPLAEWTIPAFAIPAEAGTYLPTPERWKAELALVGWLVTYQTKCPASALVNFTVLVCNLVCACSVLDREMKSERWEQCSNIRHRCQQLKICRHLPAHQLGRLYGSSLIFCRQEQLTRNATSSYVALFISVTWTSNMHCGRCCICLYLHRKCMCWNASIVYLLCWCWGRHLLVALLLKIKSSQHLFFDSLSYVENF